MTIRIFYVNTAKEDDMAFNYKDPRWQKRRLEIMERDGFECVVCGDKESELHVHHKRYRGQPWDAEDDDLQTLCVYCHMALGEHPKAGIYYTVTEWEKMVSTAEVQIDHCPKCGRHQFFLSPCSGLACLSGECDHHIPKFGKHVGSVRTPTMLIDNECIDDPDLLSTIIRQETGE